MHPELYKAVIEGNMALVEELASSNSTVLLEATTQGDNVLHVAAKYDAKQVAEEILEWPQLVHLVNRKNSKGDTPLHIAARMGSLKVAEVLINCAKNGTNNEIEEGEKLLRMVNMKNDTALHYAVRYGYDQIAELLINEERGLTECINDVGEYPLFIAVDKQHVDIAKHILDTNVFSIRGRNSMNVFHAAVIRSRSEVLRLSDNLLKVQSPITYMTDISFKRFFKLISIEHSFLVKCGAATKLKYNYKDVVECLMNTCESALSETDECGWTPLHYAAHFGAVDIFMLFSKRINIFSSAAYIRDKEGMSVIHIAAREGEVYILKKLSEAVPDIWDLQDNKGQIALHHAVTGGQLDSVKFILGTKLSHNGLINHQDNEGNTALHLVVTRRHHPKIFELMIKDSKVDKTVTNKEGFTVMDILLLQEHPHVEKIWVTASVAINAGLESLENAFNKNARKKGQIETRKLEQAQHSERGDPSANDKQVEDQRQQLGETENLGLKRFTYNQLKQIASNNTVVTTLIATVSFAAGFTMPGGYRSDGQDEGMAILSRESAFRVSVIANEIAFCFSTTSMAVYCYSLFVQNLDVLLFYTNIGTFSTVYGIIAMVIAFLSGTYASLADTPGLAKAVLAVGCCCFGLEFLLITQMNVKIM